MMTPSFDSLQNEWDCMCPEEELSEQEQEELEMVKWERHLEILEDRDYYGKEI